MAQDIQSILQLLAGQGAPVDPRAQFLGQGIQAGTLPGQDLTSNLNTVLDLLSPSASRDIQEAQGGPQILESILGLGPEEVEQLIRQQTGLAVSPAQQLTSQQGLMELLPALLNAQTRQGELGVKQEEADIKGREADTGAAKAATLQQEEDRLREAFEKGTPQDRQAMFDLNLNQMALEGVDLLGQPIDKTMQRNAFRLLTLGQQNPALTALVRGLVEEGDFDTAGQLLGMDPGTLANSFRFMGLGRRSPKAGEGADLSSVQPGVEPTAAVLGLEADTALNEQADSFVQGLIDLIQSSGTFRD